MSKVSVKKELFIRFLDLLALKGEVENSEVIINCDANGLNAILQSKSSILLLKCFLAGNFKDLGTLGMDNLTMLRKFANTFDSDTIELDLNTNKLTITAPKSRTKAGLVLRDPSLIKYSIPESKFATYQKPTENNEFTLTKEIVKEITKHCSAIGVLNENGLRIEVDSGILSVYMESQKKDDLITSFNLATPVKPFKVAVNQLVLDILNTINDDVVISNNTGSAFYIKYETKDMKFEYLICPIHSKKK